MAKDETEQSKMLERLTDVQLGKGVPAVRDEPEEPREPIEPSREITPGRVPEEVVEEEEEVLDTAPPAKKEAKPSAKEPKWNIDGEELTFEQIKNRGLLSKLILTAQQFPTVQRKYQELLERNASDVTKPVETEPPAKAPAITPEQIRRVYEPMLQKAVADGHMEPDFAEAYPQHAVELMYFRDIVGTMEEKVGAVVEWIKAEVGKRKSETTWGVLNDAIDVVAAKVDKDGKPDPVVQDLKDSETRGKFTTWLRDEVDPKVKALTAENIERFWLAFNAGDFLAVTKKAAEKTTTTPRRRAQSDGATTRTGTKESPKDKSLLDRMSDSRLGSEA